MTTVFVTHDQEEALEVADEIVVLTVDGVRADGERRRDRAQRETGDRADGAQQVGQQTGR